MLDITFIWAIDFRVIDFNAEWQHYERVPVTFHLGLTHQSLLSPVVIYRLRVGQSEDGTGDLRIKNVQIWHEGRYTCTAQTVVDNDTAYADLKVVGRFRFALHLGHMSPSNAHLSRRVQVFPGRLV